MGSITSQNNTYIKNTIPMLPPINNQTLSNAMATTASGVDTTYSQLLIVSELGTSTALDYANLYTSKYQELQQAQERPQAVRSLLLVKHSTSTLERFDKALAAFKRAKLEIGSESAAAAEIRTLLDGVQGDLFNKARHYPKENMIWDSMAQRLGKCDSEREIIVREGVVRSSLYNQLSSVLKDRGGSLPTLTHLWTQVLDHLFSVLTLTT
jgi:hypothetical protein